jgi:hypothetical protein
MFGVSCRSSQGATTSALSLLASCAFASVAAAVVANIAAPSCIDGVVHVYTYLCLYRVQGVVHDERCKQQTAGYSTLSQLQGIKAPQTTAAAAATDGSVTDSSVTDSSVIDLQQQQSNVNGGFDDTAPGAFSDFADESIDLSDWINPAYLKVHC